MTDGEETVYADFTIAPSTQDDLDYVHGNLREMDERELKMYDRICSLADFESCQTIRKSGEIIGYYAFAIPYGSTALCNIRFGVFLSCKCCDKFKVAFVKASRPVARAAARVLPSWVREIVSCPAKFYTGSLIWHGRVLGFRRVREMVVDGNEFVEFRIGRKEIEQW